MKRVLRLTSRAKTLLGRGPGWIEPHQVEVDRELPTGMVADLQLYCSVGPYEIEIRVRGYDCPEILDIAGQVTRAESRHEPVVGLLFALVDVNGEDVFSMQLTDEYGEFGFSASPRGSLGVRVEGPEVSASILVWEGL